MCYVMSRPAGRKCCFGNASSQVRWLPLFYGQDGVETTEPGGKPSLEAITVKQVLTVVQLHDGILGYAVARRLDKAGWKVSEGSQPTSNCSVQVADQADLSGLSPDGPGTSG